LAIARSVERRMADRTAAAAAAAPPAAKIDSATLATIRADVEKTILDSILDSLKKMRPPEPPGGDGRNGRGDRGDRRMYGLMTRGQLDSIVRYSRGLTGLAPGANARPGTMTFTVPPRNGMDRQAFDARLANMGPPRHVIIADPPPDRAHPDLQAAGTAVMDAL